MGCTGKSSTENDENADIDDYDERYDFYNFRSKRNVKNPVPPLKDYPENANKKLESNSNNKEGVNEIEEEEENNNENTEENGDKKNKDLNNSNNNYGDLYRNKDENKNKNPNGDEYDNNKNNNINKANNNTDNNSSNNNNDEYDDDKNKKKRRKNNKNIFNETESNSNINGDTYKNMFSENGKTIPNYENNNKITIIPEEEEKKKNIKKSKINGITIVENLKDYFPDDITKEEIQNLVFEAFGDSIVDDISLYIPGQTVIYEQAIELSNYIYNFVKNKKNKNEKCLEDLNVKIDLVPLNKKLIKDKMFKGKDPSDKQLEEIYQSYGGETTDMKVLTIEFQ